MSNLIPSVIAVGKRPDSGWVQTDVEALLKTKWEGVYQDSRVYHLATRPSRRFRENDPCTRACPLPTNDNYLDGE